MLFLSSQSFAQIFKQPRQTYHARASELNITISTFTLQKIITQQLKTVLSISHPHVKTKFSTAHRHFLERSRCVPRGWPNETQNIEIRSPQVNGVRVVTKYTCPCHSFVCLKDRVGCLKLLVVLLIESRINYSA
jgi:hypothetical protein